MRDAPDKWPRVTRAVSSLISQALPRFQHLWMEQIHPRCNPGHCSRTAAKGKEACEWIYSVNIYRATPPFITLHLDSTYFAVSKIFLCFLYNFSFLAATM